MTREPQFDPSTVAKALTASCGIVTHAAAALGVTVQTVRRYIREFPECKEAKYEAREQALDLAESNVFNGLESGDKTYTIFFLKTIGRERGWVEGRELTGPNGGPIQSEVEQVTIDVDKLTQAERVALLKAMRDAPDES